MLLELENVQTFDFTFFCIFNLILSAAGTLGSPGIVIMEPQITTTNSAPLDNLISLILTCDLGSSL